MNMMYSKIDLRGSDMFLNLKNDEMDAFWHKMLELQAKTDKIREKILLKDL
jgi:hypothetical protein